MDDRFLGVFGTVRGVKDGDYTEASELLANIFAKLRPDWQEHALAVFDEAARELRDGAGNEDSKPYIHVKSSLLGMQAGEGGGPPAEADFSVRDFISAGRGHGLGVLILALGSGEASNRALIMDGKLSLCTVSFLPHESRMIAREIARLAIDETAWFTDTCILWDTDEE